MRRATRSDFFSTADVVKLQRAQLNSDEFSYKWDPPRVVCMVAGLPRITRTQDNLLMLFRQPHQLQRRLMSLARPTRGRDSCDGGAILSCRPLRTYAHNEGVPGPGGRNRTALQPLRRSTVIHRHIPPTNLLRSLLRRPHRSIDGAVVSCCRSHRPQCSTIVSRPAARAFLRALSSAVKEIASSV